MSKNRTFPVKVKEQKTEEKPKLQAGHRFPEFQTEEGRAEVKALLHKQFENAALERYWGRGEQNNHMALGLFEQISLCGYYTPEVSSSIFTMPSPTVCEECIEIYVNTFKDWMQKQGESLKPDETERQEAFARMNDTMEKMGEDFWKYVSGYAN